MKDVMFKSCLCHKNHICITAKNPNAKVPLPSSYPFELAVNPWELRIPRNSIFVASGKARIMIDCLDRSEFNQYSVLTRVGETNDLVKVLLERRRFLARSRLNKRGRRTCAKPISLLHEIPNIPLRDQVVVEGCNRAYN